MDADEAGGTIGVAQAELNVIADAGAVSFGVARKESGEVETSGGGGALTWIGGVGAVGEDGGGGGGGIARGRGGGGEDGETGKSGGMGAEETELNVLDADFGGGAIGGESAGG